MKPGLLILMSLAMFAGSAAGQDKPADKAPSGKSAPEAKKAAPVEKRVTDKDGKTYILRPTPFGMAKVEDKPVDPKSDEPPERMRGYEDGDNIRFESMTPFGLTRWVSKKTELNETEKAIWARELRNKAAKEAETKKEGK
jgi:hypothetical protein